ncbi:MAG TPA: hypothetical protein VGL82_09765 [Bryobacteraceae bacterium]|jgi:hypothetical protein
MKFVTGLILGAFLAIGGANLMPQPERAMHPRLARAIEALRDGRDYMEHAPHDFGERRADAIRDRRRDSAIEFRSCLSRAQKPLKSRLSPIAIARLRDPCRPFHSQLNPAEFRDGGPTRNNIEFGVRDCFASQFYLLAM